MLFACLRRKFPRLSLGTVYRNLEILRRQGLVLQLAGDGQQARFDGDVRPHAHFFCRKCGTLQDLPLSSSGTRALAPPAKLGLKSETVRLEWVGLCRRCSPPQSNQEGKRHESQCERDQNRA
jgi:Fe2+ or Zn2+ uptake regulation protein